MTIFIQRTRLNPFSSVMGILIMVLVLVGIFYVAKGVFWLLSQVAVFLLVASLIIHYKTAVNYLKWVWSMWQKNWMHGLGLTLLSALLYPILFAHLFFKSMLDRKVATLQEAAEQQHASEYVDFEELESNINARKEKKKSIEVVSEDRYRDLFE